MLLEAGNPSLEIPAQPIGTWYLAPGTHCVRMEVCTVHTFNHNSWRHQPHHLDRHTDQSCRSCTAWVTHPGRRERSKRRLSLHDTSVGTVHTYFTYTSSTVRCHQCVGMYTSDTIHQPQTTRRRRPSSFSQLYGRKFFQPHRHRTASAIQARIEGDKEKSPFCCVLCRILAVVATNNLFPGLRITLNAALR